MNFKYDKPYINIQGIEQDKIDSLITLSNNMDSQNILYFSTTNKIPLFIVNDKYNNNLIHLCLLNNKPENTLLNHIKFLLLYNVNPDQPNKYNKTPLHIACEYQYNSIVTLFVENKVNVNYQDNNGLSPLHYLFSGQLKIYKDTSPTDFIVIKEKQKSNKELIHYDKNNLLQLKKFIYDIILKNDIFKIYKTILPYIYKYIIQDYNNYKTKIDYYKELFINNFYDIDKFNRNILTFKSLLDNIILSKFNKFTSCDDIKLILYDPTIHRENEDVLIIQDVSYTESSDNRYIYCYNLYGLNIKKYIDAINTLINKYTFNISNNLDNNFNLQTNDNLETLKTNSIIDRNIYSILDNIIDKLVFIGGPIQVNILVYDDDIINKLISLLSLYSLSFNGSDVNSQNSNINSQTSSINSQNGGNGSSDNSENSENSENGNDSENENYSDNINFDNIYTNNVMYYLIYMLFNIFFPNTLNPLSINELYFTHNLFEEQITYTNNTDNTDKTKFTSLFTKLYKDNNINHIYSEYIQWIYTWIPANINSHKIGLQRNNPKNYILYYNCSTIIYLLLDIANNYDNNNTQYILHNIIIKYFFYKWSKNLNDSTKSLSVLAIYIYILFMDSNSINDISISIYDYNYSSFFDSIYNEIYSNINIMVNEQSLLHKDNNTIVLNICSLIMNEYKCYDKTHTHINYKTKQKIVSLLTDIYETTLPYKFPYIYMIDIIYFILYNDIYNNDLLLSYFNFILNPVVETLENFYTLLSTYISNNDNNITYILPTILNLIVFLENLNPPYSIQDSIKLIYYSKYIESFHLNLVFYGILPDCKDKALLKLLLKLKLYPQISYATSDPNNHFLHKNINTEGHLYNYANYRIPTCRAKIYTLTSLYNYYNVYLKTYFDNTLLCLNSNSISFLNLDNIHKMYIKYLNIKYVIEKQVYINNLLDSKNSLFDLEKYENIITDINTNIYNYQLYNYLKNYRDIFNYPSNCIFAYLKDNITTSENIFYIIYPVYDNNDINIIDDCNVIITYDAEFKNIKYMSIDIIYIKTNNLNLEYICPHRNNYYTLYCIFIRYLLFNLSTKIFTNKVITDSREEFNKKVNSSSVRIINTDKYYTYLYNLYIYKLIENVISEYSQYMINIISTDIIKLDIFGTKLPDTTKDILFQNISQNTPNLFNSLIYNDIKIYNNLTNIDSTNKINYNIFYNIIEKKTKNDFYFIYSSDYTNLSSLKLKNYIFINYKIFEQLLNNNASLLYDYNNNICFSPIIKYYNHKILSQCIHKLDKLNINIKLPDFIFNDLKNHISILLPDTNNYFNSINIFIQPFYNDIKCLLLSDSTYGFNVLKTIKLSFYICFYIINEYITNYLWNFTNIEYSKDIFTSILLLLNYDIHNIENCYLYDTIIKNNVIFQLNSEIIIIDEIIEILQVKLQTEEDKYNKYNNELKIYTTLQLSYNNNTEKQLQSILNIIQELKQNITYLTHKKTNISISPSISINYTQSYNILERYISICNCDTVNNNNNIIYIECWNKLFNNNLLQNTYNLSLLSILQKQIEDPNNINKILDENIINYFDHINNMAETYFNNPKYINETTNYILYFINNLLIHLTKIIICYNIEQIIRKLLFNHYMNISHYNLDEIIGMIDRIINQDHIYIHSFYYILYNDIPEQIVKNSILLFNSKEDKLDFTPKSIIEILQNLFDILSYQTNEIPTIIINYLNNEVATYFNLFSNKLINNWYMLCENIFKYIINHNRMIKTANIIYRQNNKN